MEKMRPKAFLPHIPSPNGGSEQELCGAWHSDMGISQRMTTSFFFARVTAV